MVILNSKETEKYEAWMASHLPVSNLAHMKGSKYFGGLLITVFMLQNLGTNPYIV